MTLTKVVTRTALGVLVATALCSASLSSATADRTGPAAAATAAHGGLAPTAAQPGGATLRTLAAPQRLRVGTAVDTDALANDATYRDMVGTEFSSVTAENVMKWQLVEPERGQLDFAAADRLVAFARRHGQHVRGHVLVWHNQLPTWLTDGVADGSIGAAELRRILRQHIFEEVGHFRGKITQWDVVNEAFNEDGTLRDTLFLRLLGPSYIADAFRWAHQADPGALLFYNDFNIEGINPKSDATYALVRQFQRQGVPIHGVGAQGHFGAQFGFPGDVLDNLRRFEAIGMETAITEADVRMPLPPDNFKVQAQAQGYSVLMKACLLVRRCNSFTVWGFTDKYSWVPGVFDGEGSATLFTEDFEPKPAYDALRLDLAVANRR
jgi:endo-1,4-beta-xylanase